MNPRIKDVQALEDYKLLLAFDNKEIKSLRLNPIYPLEYSRELVNSEMFNSVKASHETIQWNNEAEFCPDTLYLESCW